MIGKRLAEHDVRCPRLRTFAIWKLCKLWVGYVSIWSIIHEISMGLAVSGRTAWKAQVIELLSWQADLLFKSSASNLYYSWWINAWGCPFGQKYDTASCHIWIDISSVGCMRLCILEDCTLLCATCLLDACLVWWMDVRNPQEELFPSCTAAEVRPLESLRDESIETRLFQTVTSKVPDVIGAITHFSQRHLLSLRTSCAIPV